MTDLTAKVALLTAQAEASDYLCCAGQTEENTRQC